MSIDPPAGAGALAPNLRADGEGLLATWLEPTRDRAHRLRISRYTAQGWSPAVTIVEDRRLVANWADMPSVAVGADGTLVAHWAEASGTEAHAYDAVVARSADRGASWTRIGRLHEDPTPAEHGFVSLVAEADGIRAFWLDGRETARAGGATALRTAMVGATVTGEAVVDARVCDCCQTSAATTGDGPLVVYRDRTDDELRDVGSARIEAGAWKPRGAVAVDGWRIAGCPVNGPAIDARDPMVAVAWYSYAGSVHRVRAAFSRDGGTTFGAPVEVDAPRGGRAPVGRVGIILDGDTAIVSWLASEREAGSILVRRVAADGAVGAELAVARSAAGRDAGFPRLARTGDAAVVAWTEPGEPSRVRAVRVRLVAIPAATAGADAPVTVAPAVAAVGSVAPSPPVVTLEGAPIDLASLRGKVVLLNLWATWCEPCRHELPVLAGLHARDGGRGLVVVGLNVDRQRTPAEIADFVARRKLPFSIWRDAADGASAALGVSTYPANLVIGRDGVIRWRRDGAILADDPELRRALDEALAAPR